MRSLLFCALFGALVVSPGTAHAQSKDALERNYKKKLESGFLSKVEWKHTLAEAMELAKEKDLPIVGYFTRSFSP